MLKKVQLFLFVFLLSGAVSAVADFENLREIDRLYAKYSQRLAVPDVEPEQLLAHPVALLVDVRTAAERAVSMLPGAIDRESYEALPFDQRQHALIYCTIGLRSGEYVIKLAAQGIEAKNLAGGLLAWAHIGGELRRGKIRVQQAHVYGRRWRLLPDRIEARWFWWAI